MTTTEQYSYILQHINLQIGKVYTLAFCASDISSQHCIAVYNEDLSTMSKRSIGSNDILITNFTAEYNTMTMLYYPGFSSEGGSSVLKWAALYEGAYTVDTLPTYTPKGKRVEMLNCGVPLAPHNLLDNSNFNDPVNQLGLTSFTPIGKNLDRWEANLSNKATITIGNGKITISKSETGGNFG